MSAPSIRRYLLRLLISSICGLWLLGATFTYIETKHEVAELFDAQLAQSARSLLSVFRRDFWALETEQQWFGRSGQLLEDLSSHAEGHKYEKKLAFQLWTAAGVQVLRSDSAPLQPLSNLSNGYSEIELDGHTWTVFSIQDDTEHFVLHMGERDDVRGELIHAIALQHSVQLLLLLPVIGVVIWVAVGVSLRPLKRVTREISDRQPNSLEPVSSEGVPAEVVPLVRELNRLFERLQRAFENERQFTGNAAHEMRTPLAGVRMQAQVALEATDPAVQKNALGKILVGIDRMTHLVEQLLVLARLDPEQGLKQPESIDLEGLINELLQDYRPRLEHKQMQLDVSLATGVSVTGMPHAIRLLFRNLIDNAIRYTPEGGSVKISTTGKPHAQVCIEDSGPGIQDALKKSVLERFNRGELRGNAPDGSGLGLSIAQQVVELHHAKLQMADSVLGGLKTCVTFS